MGLSPHPFSSFNAPSELPEQPASEIDRNGVITTIYVLYGIGFFFHITALIGFIVAYVYGQGETGRNKLHFEFQKGIFKVGILFFLILCLLGLACGATIGFTMDQESVVSFIILSIVCLIGALLSLYGFIWTIMAILFGLKALTNNKAPTNERILGISPLPKKYR